MAFSGFAALEAGFGPKVEGIFPHSPGGKVDEVPGLPFLKLTANPLPTIDSQQKCEFQGGFFSPDVETSG